VKRIQDKEQLREFEKTKTQLESMMEFKARIMESQAALQRDLQRAKQEAREAIEAKDAHAEEMSELAETVEMATLDKEMAEEKVRLRSLKFERLNFPHLVLPFVVKPRGLDILQRGGIGRPFCFLWDH